MKFHDLGAQYAALKDEIDAGIARVIQSEQFILGQPVAELEDALAKDVGRAHCVSCGNGTDALQMVLRLWGVQPGDAVFAPDFTYFASAGCAASVGASVVPVDIDPVTFNISPEALEEAIARVKREGTLRPRVAIAVDLFGLPADYSRLSEITGRNGMLLLEDAAQGYGGQIGDRRACSFGDAAITSFFPAKPLGCYGDGGAVFVGSEQDAALLRSIRANGRSAADKYDNERFGVNSRLDTLQAAILLPKLRALRARELDMLDHAAERYTQALADTVITPAVSEGYRSSWAQYSVMLRDKSQRDAAQAALKALGIPTMIYYPRGIHSQRAFAADAKTHPEWFADELFRNSHAACERVLALPMHPYLTQEDAATVVSALVNFLQQT